jgi:hypothetical protein
MTRTRTLGPAGAPCHTRPHPPRWQRACVNGLLNNTTQGFSHAVKFEWLGRGRGAREDQGAEAAPTWELRDVVCVTVRWVW